MVDKRWAMTKVVRSRAMSLSWACIACSARESNAEVASSKIRIAGFFNKVRAIATRCFSPPDNFNPRSPTGVS